MSDDGRDAITLTDADGTIRGWESLKDAQLLVGALSAAIGKGAVIIVMVAKNGAPHSRHHVSWGGSCLEVRGLLAQGTEIIQARLHGTNPHPDDAKPELALVGAVSGNGIGGGGGSADPPLGKNRIGMG